MSLAVFTDSTTAQASPALTLRPTSGSSTKTTAVSSCCAWSVMPIVATPPESRTHSWDFAYFRSAGISDMVPLSQGASRRSMSFSINWLRHDYRGRSLAADLNFDRRLRCGGLRRDIAHADADSKGWALRSARHFAQSRGLWARATNRVVRAWRRAFVGHPERY